MKISVLGSCSKGNSTYIQCGDKKILIDVGFSMKKINEKLGILGTNLSEIDAILITHEHSDHINGLGAILRKYGIKTYINKKSFLAIREKIGNIDKNLIEYIENNKFFIDDVLINPLELSHDAYNCYGYTIEYRDYKFGYVTDTGYINNVVKHACMKCNAIAIESNYDYEKLMLGNYPNYLKERIHSKYGHLSNEDAMKFIKNVISNDLKKIYMMHISQENNELEIIEKHIENLYNKDNYDVNIEIVTENVTELYQCI